MIIEPQPGPQTIFFSTPADIAIYGGAAGSGKSFALLLEPLRHKDNPLFGGVVFRRNSTQVRNQGGLWDESMKLYPLCGAQPRQAFLDWVFPSGMKLKFAHLEHEMTVLDWQGSQIPLLCCEENEKIKTKEGSKPLKEIKVGDLVLTLQGFKKVLWVGKRRLEDCVELTSDNLKQIQSTTHKILTPNGWISYADKCDELRPSYFFLSKGFHSFRKFFVQFYKKSQFLLKLACNLFCHLAPRSKSFESQLDHRSLSECDVYKVQQDQNIYYGSSQCAYPTFEQQPSVHLHAVRFLRFPDSQDHVSFLDKVSHELPDVQRVLRKSNFLDRYLIYFHRYGEFASLALEKILFFFRKPIDVVEQNQNGLPLDDQDSIPKYTRDKLQYVHPYRGYEQISEAEYSLVPCEMRPCGKKWVIDLTVEEESHYITKTGLINKNCFDELTHFTYTQFFYMMSRNRSVSGVPGYIRATCNPDKDSWVRDFIDWWIGPDGYPVPERSGVLRWFIRQGDNLFWADTREHLIQQFGVEELPKSVTFIAANIFDNKILLEKDPSYLSNLKALARVDRERLLSGNWDIRANAGTLFRREWFRVVDAIPSGWHSTVRFWDRASTKPHEGNRDPDWTRGLKMYRYPNGTFMVADLKSMRDTPGQVEDFIKNVASQDGTTTRVMSQQDPGSAGVAEAVNFVRMLAGYDVRTTVISKDKITRAKPVSAQSEVGNILILRAPWNDEFFTELENFPEGSHDDIVDVLSGAFNELSGGHSTIDVYHLMQPR